MCDEAGVARGSASVRALLPGGSMCVSVPVLMCAEASPSSQSGVAALRASMCKGPTGKTGIQGLTLGRVSESSAGGIHIGQVYRYFTNNESPFCSARVRGISTLALCVNMRKLHFLSVLVCAASCVYRHSVHVCLLSLATGWTWGQATEASLLSGYWIWQQMTLSKSDICGGKDECVSSKISGFSFSCTCTLGISHKSDILHLKDRVLPL